MSSQDTEQIETAADRVVAAVARSAAFRPPVWDRGHLVDKAVDAYARSGVHLDRDVVDLHLLETVDHAACSLLRDQWKADFPAAAYGELLSTIAALRAVLGYSPTPTAVDVNAWARGVKEATAEAAGGSRTFYEVQIVEGPHRGVLLPVWGPTESQEPGMLAGPLLTMELPTELGDSTGLEYGTAYYQRLKRPNPQTAQWEYWLDRSHPFPARGARPHFLPVPANSTKAGS